jgi:Leucine-rich repeat (LRR) protein
LLTFDKITSLAKTFPSLDSLSASKNQLSVLSAHSLPQTLTVLTLEGNDFTSLASLCPMSELANLKKLYLRGNKISDIPSMPNSGMEHSSGADFKFMPSLYYVDLSYNAINDWSFIDSLHDIFPGLTELRVSHNPLYEVVSTNDTANAVAVGVEEGYMLTIARLRELKSLNFSNVCPFRLRLPEC